MDGKGGWIADKKNDFGRLVVMGTSNFTGVNYVENGVLRGDATFGDLCTFDSLYLTPQRLYQFGGGQTTTINKVLSLEGLCTGTIMLKSTIRGLQGILHKNFGPVTGNYLSIQDIKVEGGPTFTAYNSVDLGNNSGWTINKVSPLLLYWVGGNGNWDDPAHWSFSSGGSEGACLPTSIDDVFFDAMSFTSINQTVTVNTGNAACRNMIWTGAKFNPIFTGPKTNALHLNGSLVFIPEMVYDFGGPVYFEAGALTNTVTTCGHSFLNDLVFQGLGGWLLQDSLTTKSAIQLKSGSLTTNGKTIHCSKFYSNEVSTRSLNIENSLIDIKSASQEMYYSPWSINGTGLTFNSMGSEIVLEGLNTGYNYFQHWGTPQKYNDVKMLYAEQAIIYGGGCRFNHIMLGESLANAPNFVDLKQVHFADSIVTYSHTISPYAPQSTFSYDSVRYIGSYDNLIINSGRTQSYACKIVISKNVTIQTNNKIDSLWVYGDATINQNNLIRCDSIFGNATFNGSGYEDPITNLKVEGRNDFGRLVVKGSSLFAGINRVEHAVLLGNGLFQQFNTFDSLYLSPGRIYQIRAADVLKVNDELQIRGNNCFPIQLHSMVPGQQATIWKPDGIVSGDFLELRDLNATGGATFFAGSYSNNQGNNNGWNWTNSPGYVYGLGPDENFCIGEVLNTVNFNGAYSYLWQDGSTSPNFTIKKPGTYWVEATYTSNCMYRDEINISIKPTPEAKIMTLNPVICSSGRLQLEGVVTGGELPYTYFWTPSGGLSDILTSKPFVSPLLTTDYIFKATGSNGCSSSDTIRVNVSPPIVVNLQVTDPITNGTPTGSITALTQGGLPFKKGSPYQYLWNTTPSQNSSSITELLAGSYSATVSDSLGCTESVSAFVIDPLSDFKIKISSDTICVSETSMVQASGASLYEFFIDNFSQGLPSAATTFSISGLTPGNHKIMVRGTSENPSRISTAETTINIEPLAVGGKIIGGNNINYGLSTGILNLENFTGKIQRWEKKFNSGNWITIANTTPFYSETPNKAGIWTFRAVVKNGNCSETNSSDFELLVNPKELTVTGAKTENKVYDGNTTSTISGATLTDVIAPDDVKLANSTSGTFAQSKVGTGIAVSTLPMTLKGTGSGNYSLVQPTGLKADITQKELTVSGAMAQNKIYDGNTTATISGATLTGVIAPDVVQLANATFGTFAQPNVATSITVTTLPMTITGTGSDNYSLVQPTGLKAEITQKELTVIAADVNKCFDGKVFNGTYSVNFSGFVNHEDIRNLDGVLSSSGNAIAAINSGNYTIIPSGLNSINYNLNFQNGTLTINPLPVPEITYSTAAYTESLITFRTDPMMSKYIWTVSPEANNNPTSGTNKIDVSWDTPGDKVVAVKVIDENGCESLTPSQLTVNVRLGNPKVTIVEGFSPNGDGLNDQLIFKGLERYPGSSLYVFNMNGQVVYKNDDYLNNWDGNILNNSSFDGVRILAGTYYYLLKIGRVNQTIKGYIYIGY